MTASPIGEAQRLEVIDALRGFALAGVLLANLPYFSLYAFLPDEQHAALPFAAVDRLLEPAITVLVAGKFITLFSLLFGVGFALQMQRLTAAGDGPGRYARRLLVLLGLGFAHGIGLWWGDILHYYALLGLCLIPLARWRPGSLAVLGVAIALLAFPLARLAIGDLSLRVPSLAGISPEALSAFSSDAWSRVVAMNLAMTAWFPVAYWGMVFFVAGRLLLGTAIGKSGMLDDPARHVARWRRLLFACLPTGLLLTIVIQACDYGFLPTASAWFRTTPGHAVMSVLRDLSTLSLGLAYLAGFVLLFQRPAWRHWLQHLAPIGRMALSNYLAHSLVGVAIFYGVGFAIGPRYGLVGVVIAWALLFAAQIIASRWWLAHFRFGPVEWLWRSLTYGRAQALRR